MRSVASATVDKSTETADESTDDSSRRAAAARPAHYVAMTRCADPADLHLRNLRSILTDEKARKAFMHPKVLAYHLRIARTPAAPASAQPAGRRAARRGG